ncbi:MAG: enoyl-CoA hydratase/isomerase family protein [Proteobacteria bacterium]|nr:enoyl-CoA hydratase/isomerase family protein [Pseudomonadota bacterium]
MGYETLIVEKRGPVGWLILNRPEVLNAQNGQMGRELPLAWRELDADDDVRVIVNTGTGRGFQTGMDVKEVASEPERIRGRHDADTRRSQREGGSTAIDNQVWKPVICAVNGICAGLGFHFVMGADIVIASSDASFTDPHVSVGQVSALEPIGLIRRIPFEAVARMVFTGRHERFGPERALQLGLIGEIVDPPEELQARAQELGETIARNSPAAMRESKKAMWSSLDRGLTEALDHGMDLVSGFWGHPDDGEGARAFAEKREPRWAPPGAGRP